MNRYAMRVRRVLPAALLAALMLLGSVASAAAKDLVPFHATFQEQVVPGSVDCSSFPICHLSATGSGTASHLGKTTELLNVTLDFSTYTDQNPCYIGIDMRTLTAANGDQLFIHGVGTFCEDNAGNTSGSINWTVTGGAGRFSGASGSGTETLFNNGSTIRVVYTGKISSPSSLT